VVIGESLLATLELSTALKAMRSNVNYATKPKGKKLVAHLRLLCVRDVKICDFSIFWRKKEADIPGGQKTRDCCMEKQAISGLIELDVGRVTITTKRQRD